MVGAEQQPGEEQFAVGGGVNPFDALVGNQSYVDEGNNQEQSLQLAHPFDPFNQMRKFTSAYERKQWNELGFHPTEEQKTMVRHVKIAYGIIAEPFCEERTGSGELSRVYQDIIVNEIGIDQMITGNRKVVLTDEERDILVNIAKSAGIPCNPEKKEYRYDEIPSAYWLDKHKSYRTSPSVVDADQ